MLEEKLEKAFEKYADEETKKVIKEVIKQVQEKRQAGKLFSTSEIQNALEVVGLTVCYDCYEVIPIDMAIDVEGDVICEDCVNNGDYMCCDYCGEYHDITNMKYMHDIEGYYCDDCASNYGFRCECCREYYTTRHTEPCDVIVNTDGDTEVYCEGCTNLYVTTCEDCGDMVHQDAAYYSNGGYYCPMCADDHRNVAIHDYSYKPDPIFNSVPEEKYSSKYFGLELEVDDGEEDPEEVAKEVTDVSEGFIYCKYDGSLSNGFEIVTHPATVNWYIRNKDKIEKIVNICKEAGFRSHDTSTCGLHIHVSRSFFGEGWAENEENVNKLILLTEIFKDELLKFSRRQDLSYCKFLSDIYKRRCENDHYLNDDSFKLTKIENVKYAKSKTGRERYQVINTNNSSTIEFRLIRGTLNIDTLYASLQLFNNLCDIAVQKSYEEMDGMTWADIINYNEYKENHILEYCKKRNIKSNTVIKTKEDAPCV